MSDARSIGKWRPNSWSGQQESISETSNYSTAESLNAAEFCLVVADPALLGEIVPFL